MNALPAKPMRDVLIEALYDRMVADEKIFFLSSDMGAPALDRIRADIKDRFINVGIAEQNLINVAAGLAMEGFTVYTYAIASFYFRAYEQIRINLALPSQLREMNVNMLALGAGFSYDVSGPTHHCLDDISAMRTMPNVMTISPCDWNAALALADYAPTTPRPKYFRLDGKPLPAIYPGPEAINFVKGFTELCTGRDVCFVAVGVMVHQALKIVSRYEGSVGVIDVFMLDNCNEDELASSLSHYSTVITLEEGYINRGGLESLVANLITERGLNCRLKRFGVPNKFELSLGDRYMLHEANKMNEYHITRALEAALI